MYENPILKICANQECGVFVKVCKGEICTLSLRGGKVHQNIVKVQRRYKIVIRVLNSFIYVFSSS